MPGIKLFGKRWKFSSDDLFYPSLMEILLRAAWLIVLVLALVKLPLYDESRYRKIERIDENQTDVNCTSQTHTEGWKGYLFGLAALMAVHIILGIVICIVATRGTILQAKPRKLMPAYIYIKAFLILVDVAALWYAVIWNYINDCKEWNIWILGIVSYFAPLCIYVFILTLVLIKLCINPFGGKVGTIYSNNRYSWCDCLGPCQAFFKTLFCCCVGPSMDDDIFSDLAKLMYAFFPLSRFVPSDYVAGLLLLAKHKYRVLIPERAFPMAQQWMTPENASHFFKYCMASYGWKVHAKHSVKAACCGCYGSQRPRSQTGRDCCGMNNRSFSHYAEIPVEQIAYASYEDYPGLQVPFYIAIDKKYKRIVLVFRVKQSLDEFVISSKGTPINLNQELTDQERRLSKIDEKVPLSSGDFAAHQTLWQIASNTFNILDNRGLIERTIRMGLNSDYKITCVGHGVGAAVATLVGLKLRQLYPDTTVFAYSPPGMVVSNGLREVTKNFVLTVIIGADVVPRLNWQNIIRIKLHMVRQLERTKMPKYRITTGAACCQCLNNNVDVEDWTDDFITQADILNEMPSKEHLLYLPGQLMYLTKFEGRWKLCWADQSDFNRILITKNAITHHYVGFQYDLLKKVVDIPLTEVDTYNRYSDSHTGEPIDPSVGRPLDRPPSRSSSSSRCSVESCDGMTCSKKHY